MLINTAWYRGIPGAAASLAAGLLLVSAVGCRGVPPFRPVVPETLPSVEDCRAVYEKARWDDARGFRDPAAETAHIQTLIHEMVVTDQQKKGVSTCWSSSVELHAAAPERPEYDLFSLEFDDQGWLANVPTGALPVPSQLSLLMDYLDRMIDGGQPLQVVTRCP